MTDTKKSLRSELNLKTITRKDQEEKDTPDYEPDSILAAQVTEAIKEHFDSRETNYQPVNWVDSYDNLELTADHLSKGIYIAPRNNELDGLYNNIKSFTPELESKSKFVREPMQFPGGGTTAGNYNGYGQKNSVIPQDITEEEWSQGYYYKWAKHPQRYWGNISARAYRDSLGYVGMPKIQGFVG